MLLVQLVDLYSLIVLVAVILSWLQLPYNNPIVQLVGFLTEPLLAPIRSVLPSVGGLDFSPMVLLIALQMLKRIVAGAFA
jgi:YggT family protein